MNKLFRGIVTFGRKHDNVLFAIGEIALGTAAVIFAVKNTVEYEDDIPWENIHGEKSELEPKEKAKHIVTHYWPTAVCLGGFIALRTVDCIYTQNVRSEYAKALMAAQSALLAKKPRNNTKKIAQNDSEDHPEGTEMQDKRAENAYDQYEYQFWFCADDMPEAEESVYTLDGFGSKQAFYIPATGRLFISTLQDVLNAQMYSRMQIESGKDLYLNDMYKYLGIGSDGMGHDLYIEKQISDDEDEFSFDLAPGLMDYNDGFGSSDLIYTINPNKWIHNINLTEN